MLPEPITEGPATTPSIPGRKGGDWGRFSKRLAAGGPHLWLLEEESSFSLDNWLQQRASPLAGRGTLWQALTSRLHCEPLPISPPALRLLCLTRIHCCPLMMCSNPLPPKVPRKTSNNQSSFQVASLFQSPTPPPPQPRSSHESKSSTHVP